MGLEFCSGLPEPVRQAYDRLCSGVHQHSGKYVETARRLVTDQRMEALYRSQSLSRANGSNAEVAWRLWFDIACTAAEVDERPMRDAGGKLRKNVSRLISVLDEARRLLEEIEGDALSGAIVTPEEFADALHLIEVTAQNPGIVDEGEWARYESGARQLLEDINLRDGGPSCFIPTVPQLIAGLHVSATNFEGSLGSSESTRWSASGYAELLESQKSNPYRTYVRRVDHEMRGMRIQYAINERSECWRLPDKLLAIQCKVAFGLGDLEGFADRVRKMRLNPKSEDFPA
ncbi:hypothetical protein PCO31111_01421 [Pandoraea communis]|uniref:Uncharacterized protein n=1 Tax=Pandoraea communis TaxID=2508297 RepID=A0A5E4TG67_9BURK|nr:hypothetical protein [Pandoraea communis]VVD86895.1 hypothetical protein PCO31111_01421 [Pandoraea communis]